VGDKRRAKRRGEVCKCMRGYGWHKYCMDSNENNSKQTFVSAGNEMVRSTRPHEMCKADIIMNLPFSYPAVVPTAEYPRRSST
jgi:hypothetical protein